MRAHKNPLWLVVLTLIVATADMAAAVSADETRKITDSRGIQTFASAPQRVISLNWALTEQLIELGITPAGVADPKGYSAWVAEPAIPDASVDVGKREGPNPERILGLQPDLILLGGQQSAYIGHIEPVAPVLHFDLFAETHDNAAAVRANFLDLGTLFGRREMAEKRLAAMDRRLAELRSDIRAAYPDGMPRVTVIRFIDDKRVVISGTNGLPEAAMNALGLETGFPIENSQWGIAFKPVTALAEITEGYVIHMEPFEKGNQLFNTALWREMPFVKADRFRSVTPLWTYGGALSIGRIGEAVAQVLLADKGR